MIYYFLSHTSFLGKGNVGPTKCGINYGLERHWFRILTKNELTILGQANRNNDPMLYNDFWNDNISETFIWSITNQWETKEIQDLEETTCYFQSERFKVLNGVKQLTIKTGNNSLTVKQISKCQLLVFFPTNFILISNSSVLLRSPTWPTTFFLTSISLCWPTQKTTKIVWNCWRSS